MKRSIMTQIVMWSSWRLEVNTYTRAIQGKWLIDKVALGKERDKENQTPMYAFKCRNHPDPKINPDKPPWNFGDAMKTLDKQAWAAAYN